AALSRRVDGRSAEAAGELLQVLPIVAAGKEAHPGTAEVRRTRYGLPFASVNVGAEGTGRFGDRERVGFGAGSHQERSTGVRAARDIAGGRKGAVEARVSDDHARGVVGEGKVDALRVGGSVRTHGNLRVLPAARPA